MGFYNTKFSIFNVGLLMNLGMVPSLRCLYVPNVAVNNHNLWELRKHYGTSLHKAASYPYRVPRPLEWKFGSVLKSHMLV